MSAGSDLLAPGPTRVMGILNVTPDSFSDGGMHDSPAAAATRARALWDAGAAVIDVGGESTRPGATRPSAAVEIARVSGVIAELAADGITVSVDTMRAEVARVAVAAGASMVNDVSGGLADPDMLPCVAELAVPYVLTHWRGHAGVMQQHARYHDVVGEVADELGQGVGRALQAGIARESLVLDPGIGFAKTAEHNWALLAGLDRLDALGLPLLVGVSRKGFLGRLLGANGVDRPPTGRDAATLALSVVLAQRHVWGIRVHAVAAHHDALRVVARLADHGSAVSPPPEV